MKQYLLLSVLLCLLLTACQNAPAPPAEPAEPLQFEQPTFLLSELPALTAYNAPREIVNRYAGDDFVDTLKPADDYGRLYPYEGRVVGAGWWEARSWYGLVDKEGRIVVDPVYRYAYYQDVKEGEEPVYLMLAYPVDKDDAEAQQLLLDSEGWIQRGRYVFAAADGSWVSEEFYGDEASLSEERIIIRDYGGNIENVWSGRGQSFRIYDLQGSLIASAQGQFYSFQEGRGSVYHAGESDQDQGYYYYIDRDGRVAIPGPFLEASNFVEGRANVSIGEDWEHRRWGVIDTAGNFIEGPSANISEENYYEGDYTRFYQGNDYNRLVGVKDRAGNIIIPATYDWVGLAYEPGSTLAIGDKEQGNGARISYLLDLQSGAASEIKLEGENVTSASVSGNNWCVVEYEGGTALLKGEQEYRFDVQRSDGEYLYCRYMQDDLFALNYEKPNENHRTVYRVDIFDAVQGRVVKSIANCHYSNTVNNKFLSFYLPGNSRILLLNRDFTPAFSPEVFGGDMLRDISHVADDVYRVRTNLTSGLLRENGEWLVRVNVNNLD